MKLTDRQYKLLQSLVEGAVLVYSRDGDTGWLSYPDGTNGKEHYDSDVVTLRNLGYLKRGKNRYEDDDCDTISNGGRAALEQSKEK